MLMHFEFPITRISYEWVDILGGQRAGGDEIVTHPAIVAIIVPRRTQWEGMTLHVIGITTKTTIRSVLATNTMYGK